MTDNQTKYPQPTLSRPQCPDCGSDMEQRTNQLLNVEFWGCSKYPKCRATVSQSQTGDDAYRHQAEVLRAEYDIRAVEGGTSSHSPEPRTHIAKSYSDGERAMIFAALMETGNDPKKAQAKLEEWNNEGISHCLTDIDTSAIRSIRRRYKGDFWEAIGSSKGIKVLLELIDGAESENVRLAAIKEVFDRDEGKPIARIQQTTVSLSHAEVEQRFREQRKKYAPKTIEGELVDED